MQGFRPPAAVRMRAATEKKKQEVIASRPMLGMPGGIQAQAQYTGAPPAPTALFVQASDRGSPTRKPPSPFGLRAPARTMDGSGGGSSKSGFWSQRGLPGFSMTIPENKIKNLDSGEARQDEDGAAKAGGLSAAEARDASVGEGGRLAEERTASQWRRPTHG